MAAVMMTGPGGDYVDDDGYFTCAVSVQHKVGPLKDTSQRKIIFAQLWHFDTSLKSNLLT